MKEIPHRHVERLGKTIELEGVQGVLTAFVFLNLLEGDAGRLGKGALAHAQQLAAVTQAVANLAIDFMVFHGVCALISLRRGGIVQTIIRDESGNPARSALR